MYRQVNLPSGGINTNVVECMAAGAFIPADARNADYQHYLVWVAAGNTALAPEGDE